MNFSRRQFVKGGVTAFTFGFAAPQALCDIAFAQGVPSRNLVVVYLSGGNDSLSTVIPYRDANYATRRPTLAVPAGSVLQIGTDSSRIELGLHPRLTGLKSIFDAGRLAIVQRTGYANQSRSHFTGFDIWGTASIQNTSGTGWLGRYLDTLSNPDPLVAWNTQRETPRPLMADRVGVPAITSPATYAFSSPNTGAEAGFERTAQTRISSHLPVDRPHLAFVNSTTQAALATLDRVATVAAYRPANAYPNNGFGQALTAVAGAMNRQIGTKVFWVQTGGFDTHAYAGRQSGQRCLRQSDGHARRWPQGVPRRSRRAGTAEQHAHPRVLGVRPPHQRERQPGYRPRRRRQHDGPRRPRARRPLWNGAEPQ